MGVLAAYITKVELPTLEDKLTGWSGIILLVVVVIMALFNRIKWLFKVKSLGFVVLWCIFLLLSSMMQTLVWGLGLVTIPLLIDDIVVNGYFKYINVTRYWDAYRDVMRSGTN